MFTKAEKKVFDLLPVNGSPIRAKHIYEKGKANGISKITIERKLSEFTKNGLINRTVKEHEHKNVTYNICKKTASELLLNEMLEDFTKLARVIEQDIDKREDLKLVIQNTKASLTQLSKIVTMSFADKIRVKDKFSAVVVD